MIALAKHVNYAEDTRNKITITGEQKKKVP